MVQIGRLMSTLVVTSAITVLTLTSTKGEEDIINNLVRDPVELGNYPSRSRNVMKKIKNPNHFTRHSSSAQEPSSSSTSLEDYVQESSSSSETEKDHHQHSKENCPLCQAQRKNAGLDDDTLRAVRVEIVKRQILKKLRLKEPPKIENVPKGQHPMLPSIAFGNPVISNALRGDHDDDVANMDLEDFYGKTEQIIVLPQDEIADCGGWSGAGSRRNDPASCFIFNLPKEVRSNQISSAELWVYKLADVGIEEESNSNHTHHFSISEVMTVPNPRSSRRRSNIHFSTITSRSDIPESSSWINFNITERARKWLVADVPDHTVKISCSTCKKDVNEFPFDTTNEQQPFIVFNIANGKRRRRNRRSINCSPGITSCCRESLYISFEEIKWDWVLEPRGFDAYYCKGACHGDAALAYAASRHSGIMIDYVKNQGGVNNKTSELVPCCTATEMSSISLLYRDPQSYNTTMQRVTLPNMVVQSCGCK